MTEECENALEQERRDIGRQEVVESRCHSPESSAEVERKDETDLERWMLFAGGGYAHACDDGLSEEETADFLGSGSEGMTEQQGCSAQMDLDLLVGGLVLPSHAVKPEEFCSRMGV